MCGFCTERQALRWLAEGSHGWFYSREEGVTALEAAIYFQEAEDFPAAFDRVANEVLSRKVVDLGMIPEEETCCRALGILMAQGFDSDPYQRLLANPLFHRTISSACQGRVRQRVTRVAAEHLGGMPTYGRDPALDQEWSSLVARRFRIDLLALLWQEDTYFNGEQSLWLRQAFALREECLALLEAYCSWWLDGAGQLRVGMVERKMPDSVYDPLEELAEVERLTFAAAVRALWFSIELLGRFRGARKVLQHIATTWPASLAYFDGQDLWLRRMAVLKLYDQAGLDSLLGLVEQGTGYLLGYIDLKRGLSGVEKGRLLQEASDVDGTDRPDEEGFCLQEWLRTEMAPFPPV